MKSGQSWTASADGQALVEFALVLPMLLMLVFGIAQFGLALNSANDETHLANEVARYATVNENPGGSTTLTAWGKSQADSKALSGQTVCITFPKGKQVGDPVEVIVKGTISWLHVLGLATPSSKIEGKAVMRLEVPSTAGDECA